MGFLFLTKLAWPLSDTTNAVSVPVPVGQLGVGSEGQDEEVGLPSQKWPLLAFMLDRWIGEPCRKARRMKGSVELDWRGRRGIARERRGRSRSRKIGHMFVGMELVVAVVDGW